MTLKDKMKTYNFWISLVSAILLVARIIAGKFNVEIDSSLVMDITTGLCGIFVVLGIISAPTKPATKVISQNADGKITIDANAAIVLDAQEQLAQTNKEETVNEAKQMETKQNEELEKANTQESVTQAVEPKLDVEVENTPTEEIAISDTHENLGTEPVLIEQVETANYNNKNAEQDIEQDVVSSATSYQKEQLQNLTQQELVEIVLKLQK